MIRSSSDLAAALAALEQGQLVLLPVDTVPGLAGRADRTGVAEALHELKGRPAEKTLSLAFRDLDQLLAWVPEATRLRAPLVRLLPGPLTVVLPGSARLGAVHGPWGLSVGARLPGPCPCAPLLEALPWPLALSSANRSGDPTVRHTRDLDPRVAAGLALAWPGESPLGRESTVVDLRGPSPRILREGILDAAAVAARLGEPC